MLTNFWAGIGTRLSERLISGLVVPASLFWLVGALAYAWTQRAADARTPITKLANQPALVQGIVVVLAVLVLLGSGLVAHLAALPVLLLLEGYWPKWTGPVRDRLVGRLERRRIRWRTEWGVLQYRYADSSQSMSYADQLHLAHLDDQLHRFPPVGAQLPTRLGNLLRAAELRPRDRYGLDPVRCWYTFWLILPQSTRDELVASRRSMDSAAVVWLSFLLSLLWTPLAWWAAPVSLLGMWLSYRRLLTVAAVYGELLTSTFDVHRRELLRALRWPLPATPAEDVDTGRAVSELLWRGSDEPQPRYTTESD